jgi:phosphoribosylformylglycinamidine synthase
VTLAESALAGNVGFTATLPGGDLPAHVALFSESASRAVVTPRDGREADLEQLAGVHGVPFVRIGLTGGANLEFAGLLLVPLRELAVVYEGAIPRLMSGELGSA